MKWGAYELVSFISSVMTLLPGDVIATGTPPGIGPMSPGDRVEVAITGIGPSPTRPKFTVTIHTGLSRSTSGMKITYADRILNLPPYLFERIDRVGNEMAQRAPISSTLG